MGHNRDSILTALKENVIEVTTQNEQGRFQGRYTLDPKYLHPSYVKHDIKLQEEFHRVNPEVIAAFNMETKEWNSFWANDIILCHNISDKYE